MSPIAHEVAVLRLPAGPAIADGEYWAVPQDAKWRKEFADKLAVLTATVAVNSSAIDRQSKRGDSRYQALEEQTKQSFSAIRLENARDRMIAKSPNTETSNGLAIVDLQRKHFAAAVAVRGNTQGIAKISSVEALRASKTARKLWLMESTCKANLDAYRALCTEMSVMSDTVAKLSLNTII